MRGLARLAMRGPMFAAGSAAVLALAAMVFGLLLVPSGAVIALTTLRFGPREGLKIAAIAASFVLVVGLGLGQGIAASLMLVTMAWLPAWLLACTLTLRRAQDWPLLLAAFLVLVYAAGLRIAVGDVTAFWRDRLKTLFELMAKDAGARFTAEQIEFIVAQSHSWTVVALFCMLAAVILLARWWQAELYNPGGFGAEFRDLRLPRSATILAGALALAFALGGKGVLILDLAGDAFVLLVVLFALQGLAVVHAMARVRGLAGAWLTSLYVVLLLVPQVAGPILATTGLADDVVDFRHLRGARQP